MVNTQLASFRQKLPSTALQLAVEPGSQTTEATNYYYYLQFQNRTGLNQLSDPIQVSVPAGSKLVWTVTDNAIASGEEIFWYVLSASKDIPENAIAIAKIKARDDDQQTTRILPLSLELTTDEHFKLFDSVANVNELPLAPIEGMSRLLTTDLSYYSYDSEAYAAGEQVFSYGIQAEGIRQGSSIWIKSSNPSSYGISIPSSDRIFSDSDLLLRDIGDSILGIPLKEFKDTIPLRVWLSNGYEPDGQSPLPVGTRFNFIVFVNGENKSSLFSDRIVANIIGQVNRVTGELDTAIEESNETIIWNQVNNQIVLKTELLRGYALAIDVIYSFDNEDLLGIIPQGATIGFDIVRLDDALPTISPTNLFGDLVQSQGDRLLVVADKVLTGQATIHPYNINKITEQPLLSFLFPDSNQFITLDGAINGFARVRRDKNELEPTEKVRAFVSTEPGIGPLVFAPVVTVSQNELVTISVLHPFNLTTGKGTIRANYPDTLIAGNSNSSFTGTKGYLYLDKDGQLYQSQEISVTEPIQTFTFSDLSTFTSINALPSTSNFFGLYQANNVSVTTTSNGSLNAGIYQFYFAYNYNSPNTHLTVINHSDERVDLVTATETIADTISSSLKKDNNLSDLTDVESARQNLGITAIADFQSHLNDFDNPHRVSTSQIGALFVGSNLSDLTNVGVARDNLGLSTGVGVGDLVQLVDVNGIPGFPAIDGSNLINLTLPDDVGGKITVGDGTNDFTDIEKIEFIGAEIVADSDNSNAIALSIPSSLAATNEDFTVNDISRIFFSGFSLSEDADSDILTVSLLRPGNPEDAVLYLYGDRFVDLSKYNNTVNVDSNITIENTSYRFNASNNAISFNPSNLWELGTSDFSIEVEAKIPGLGDRAENYFLSRKIDNSLRFNFLFYLDNGGTISFRVDQNVVSAILPDTDYRNSFQVFKVSRVNGELTLYYKGNSLLTRSMGEIPTANTELKIGKDTGSTPAYIRSVLFKNQGASFEPGSGTTGITLSDGIKNISSVSTINLEAIALRDDENGSVTIAATPLESLTIKSGLDVTLPNVKEIDFRGATVSSVNSDRALISISSGVGTFLLPNSQSLFVESDNTALTAYSADVGSVSWQDIKILTTANTPNNQIVNNELVVNEVDTGAVLNLEKPDTVLELSWAVETGNNLAAIARYDSDGNMVLIKFTQSTIGLVSIINDVETAIASTPYTFTDGQDYKLTIRVVGVIYEILVDDAIALRDFSNLFLDKTLFGVGKVS